MIEILKSRETAAMISKASHILFFLFAKNDANGIQAHFPTLYDSRIKVRKNNCAWISKIPEWNEGNH